MQKKNMPKDQMRVVSIKFSLDEMRFIDESIVDIYLRKSEALRAMLLTFSSLMSKYPQLKTLLTVPMDAKNLVSDISFVFDETTEQ